MITMGTTPYHNFILPLKVKDIGAAYVTYTQNGETILEKSLDDAGVEVIDIADLYENASMNESFSEELLNSSQLSVHLTQEDTLSFIFTKNPLTRKNWVFIQVRILDKNGEVYASIPVKQKLIPAFHNEVIHEEELEGGQDI